MNSYNVQERCTASYFAEWVFKKTKPYYRPSEHISEIEDRQKLGKYVHSAFMKYWMRPVKAVRGLSSDWEPIYTDSHDGSDDRIFKASCLSIDGQHMRCKPDAVFRDKESGVVIIIERKVTWWHEDSIPQNAWPNIRAQVWCYGWIDDWINSPDVVMICQFINRRIENNRQTTDGAWKLIENPRPGWRRSDPVIQSECLKYFHEYGGKFLK